VLTLVSSLQLADPIAHKTVEFIAFLGTPATYSSGTAIEEEMFAAEKLFGLHGLPARGPSR
jgi:hypothetical protein